MKNKLSIILTAFIAILIMSGIVLAANTFPTTLNSWSSGDVIEESWANALEVKIGIDGSAVATSIDYLIKNAASKLGSIANITPTDGVFIVADGSKFVGESGSTARTSIGLGSVENTALSTWTGTSNIDTVGTLTTAGGNISLWTNDSAYITATLTEEQVEDYVGGMLGGTETHIAVTYQDATNDINFVVSDDWWDALTDMVLTDNYIYVGDASNDPVGVAMSNDCTIASNGAITCDHDALDNFVTNEHLDWTGDLGAVNIHTGNYPITDSEVPNDITIDLAATATALAANGNNCAAGSYALGVNASGAAESCTDATTEINSVVNALGGTNLTCAAQSCNVDDAFIKNNAADIMSASVDASTLLAIQNTDTTITTEGYLLKLLHDSNNDTDADFLVCQDDADGTPDTVFSIASDGETVIGGTGISTFNDSVSIGNGSADVADMGSAAEADLFITDDLEVDGHATFGSITVGGAGSGNVDMANYLILNIGHASTDFTSGGGLNIYQNLDVDGATTLDTTMIDGLLTVSNAMDTSTLATIRNTDDTITTAGYLLELIHDANDDADADFLICQDDGAGTPDTLFSIASDGSIVVGGSLTSTFNDSLSIGGLSAGTADMGTGNAADLFVSDDFEVDGMIYAEGNLSISNATTSAGVLTLLEDTDAGTNFASFQVPALAANTVYTLPPNDGGNTEVLQTDGSGTLTWVANAGGGATAWDDISASDAASTISLAGNDHTFTNVDDFTLLSTTNSKPNLILEADNVGANTGPVIKLFHDTGSPADDDDAGVIEFWNDDLANNATKFAYILGEAEDVTDAAESGSLDFRALFNSVDSSFMLLDGYIGTEGQGAIVFNEDSKDLNFRIETEVEDNFFYIDAGSEWLRIGDWDTNYAQITSGGILTFAGTGDIDLPNNSVDSGDVNFNYAGSASEGGAATTATALAANGNNCAAGSYALGVDASGAAESCTDATTEINSVVNALGGTGLTCAAQSCAVDLGTSIEAGEITAAAIDGDDVNSNIAGRSLTLTAASPDTLDADVELYTDTKCIYWEDNLATDDFKSIWTANGFAATITKIWCESDQTVNLDLQVDDGTPADVNGTDLVCDSTPAEDESMGGDATLADGDRLDLVVTSVSGTPTWCSVCWTYTKDD